MVNNPAPQIVSKHRSIVANTLSVAMLDHYNLIVNGGLNFKPGDIIMVTDCNSAAIAQLAAVFTENGRQHLKVSQPLPRQYNKNAEVGLLEYNRYYVHNNSLYRTDVHNKNTAVVAGIAALAVVVYRGAHSEITGLNLTWHLTSAGRHHLRYQFLKI